MITCSWALSTVVRLRILDRVMVLALATAAQGRLKPGGTVCPCGSTVWGSAGTRDILTGTVHFMLSTLCAIAGIRPGLMAVLLILLIVALVLIQLMGLNAVLGLGLAMALVMSLIALLIRGAVSCLICGLSGGLDRLMGIRGWCVFWRSWTALWGRGLWSFVHGCARA